MWHEWETGEMHARFLWADLSERDYLEDIGIGWREILKYIFKNWNMQTWIGLIRLRIGTGGRCL